MPFDNLEKTLVKQIDTYLADMEDPNKTVGWVRYEKSEKLIIYRDKKDIKIRFSIDMKHDEKSCRITLDILKTESEDDIFLDGYVKVPHTEEEHFQLSTVDDLGFSWSFYQYIIDVFRKLKNIEEK